MLSLDCILLLPSVPTLAVCGVCWECWGLLFSAVMGPGHPKAKVLCWPLAALPPLPAPGSAAWQDPPYPSRPSSLIPVLNLLGKRTDIHGLVLFRARLKEVHAKTRNWGDSVALVHLFSLSGAVGWMLGVSQRPSLVLWAVFCGRLQWTPAQPSFPPAFPNARKCSITTSSHPLAALGGGGERADLSELPVPPQFRGLLLSWTLEPGSGWGRGKSRRRRKCLFKFLPWCKVQRSRL